MIELSTDNREKLFKLGLSHSELSQIIDSDDIEFYLDFFMLQGLELIEEKNLFFPKQVCQTIKETSFCIVDIETNGSSVKKHQIIEIGAVIVKDGDIIDSFNMLIQADALPPSIADLTGITLDELQKAPSFKEVMHRFKSFVKGHIIVAHPLKFDYDFISASLEKAHLGMMLNLGICNIALAERTLSSAKYGLHYLNKTLGLEEDFKQHRAYNDAIITKDIFLRSITNLPIEIVTIKELIEFTKNGKKKPRAALIEV